MRHKIRLRHSVLHRQSSVCIPQVSPSIGDMLGVLDIESGTRPSKWRTRLKMELRNAIFRRVCRQFQSRYNSLMADIDALLDAKKIAKNLFVQYGDREIQIILDSFVKNPGHLRPLIFTDESTLLATPPSSPQKTDQAESANSWDCTPTSGTLHQIEAE